MKQNKRLTKCKCVVYDVTRSIKPLKGLFRKPPEITETVIDYCDKHSGKLNTDIICGLAARSCEQKRAIETLKIERDAFKKTNARLKNEVKKLKLYLRQEGKSKPNPILKELLKTNESLAESLVHIFREVCINYESDQRPKIALDKYSIKVIQDTAVKSLSENRILWREMITYSQSTTSQGPKKTQQGEDND